MVNALIVLFGLTILYMTATSRIKAHIKLLAFQGLLLFLILFFDENENNLINTIFLASETLIVKMIVIPVFLIKILNKNEVFRDNMPHIPNFYSLVIASIILFTGFIVSSVHCSEFENINTLYFGVSLSAIMTSLFLITTRKNILTHVIGYIMMENGIFLLSLCLAKEMPIIVNLGILLDIFIAVFILGLLVNRIHNHFDELNIYLLCNLKDCEYND